MGLHYSNHVLPNQLYITLHSSVVGLHPIYVVPKGLTSRLLIDLIG